MKFVLDKEPMTVEEIRQLKESLLKKQTRLGYFFYLSMIVMVVFTIYLAYFKEIIFLPSVLTCLYMYFLMSFRHSQKINYTFELIKLSPIDSSNCSHALSLCQKYLKLDNYRKAAVKNRELLHGEYLMMIAWEEEAGDKEAFQKLHGYIPWQSSKNNGHIKWEKCS